MQGDCTRRPDGIVVLDRRQKIVSPSKFTVPVTFRIIALTNNNDVRIAYPADQIIFNWEYDRDQLRIDGGPLSGKYKRSAGGIPVNKWVVVEIEVLKDRLRISVDGAERFRGKADFSAVDQPLEIFPAAGSTIMVRSIKECVPQEVP